MNNKLLKGMSVAAAALFLIGCNELKFGGSFDIHQVITFVQPSDRSVEMVAEGESVTRGGNVVINPGKFDTNVTLGQSGSKKQIKMEIKNGSKPTTVTISFDKNVDIGDSFTLTSAQTGQNFDVTGKMTTTVTSSPEQSGTESCTYQMPQTVCRGVEAKAAAEDSDGSKDENSSTLKAALASLTASFDGRPGPGGVMPPPPPPPHVPTCHTQYVTMYGYRDVSFHYQTTTKNITASFMQGATDLGDYQGSSSSNDKIYSFQGSCR